MNDTPLKVRAAMAIINDNNYTLTQLLDTIHHPQGEREHLIFFVSSDVQFWLAVARKYCGEDIALRRMDIAIDQWERFLEIGIDKVGLYTLVGNWGAALKVFGGPELFFHGPRNDNYVYANTRLDELLDPHGDYTRLRFEIDGVQPENSCLGYTTRFYFDDPVKMPMTPCYTFVCNNDESQIPEMFDRLVGYLASQFLRMCYLHLIPRFAPTENGFFIRQRSFPVMPTLLELKALFAEMLDADNEKIGIAMSQFKEDGTLRFREYIIAADEGERDGDARSHLTMFLDVSQVRF